MKYINVEKIKKEIKNLKEKLPDSHNLLTLEQLEFARGQQFEISEFEEFIDIIEQEETDMGEVSDGYHTFNELYYYRMLYNAAFFNLLPKEWVHKSKRHHTGEECFGGGWFVVQANLPTGQISNHYELKYWGLFDVPEKEFADEWDGHTPQEAAERLFKYLQRKGDDVNLVSELNGFTQHYAFENSGEFPSAIDIAKYFFKLGQNTKKEKYRFID